ncbi:DUF4123 domain-containing protein [Vibrio rumoiensis]|uniref:DUF4123 domain-containing protein n=1 Tax=Vibrio rumoiensis TaxID=76258 RepID=A0ABW7IUI5_9VIBR|nr:DUF4123 domain-containing protein [Vibrio rumoiensis]
MNNFWIVVDTVRIPDALKQLKTITVLDTVLPLYAGSDFDYLIDQSPLLINLGLNDSVLDKWSTLPLFDTSSVIFALEQNMDGYVLLNHLQNLLSVKIDQTAFLFRFYVNSIWEQVANELNEQDIHTILGPARALYWADSALKIQSFSQQYIKPSLLDTPYHLTSSIFKQWV